MTLTAERLRDAIHYDPLTGVFTRRLRTAQRHQVGDRADFELKSGQMRGYRRVSLDGERHLAHRLAWLYVHGVWPTNDIDHKDTNRGNNRISNLRDATAQVNRENIRRPMATNSTGHLGVILHSPGKWRARIQTGRKTYHIGLYQTPEAAHEAYLRVKREIHEGCTL